MRSGVNLDLVPEKYKPSDTLEDPDWELILQKRNKANFLDNIINSLMKNIAHLSASLKIYDWGLVRHLRLPSLDVQSYQQRATGG